MRLYIDVDLKSLIASPTDRSRVTQVEFKRGDSAAIDVSFVQAGAIIELASGASGKFGLKEAGKYDGGFIVSDTAWVKTGTGTATIYTFEPSFNTTELNTLLLVDGNPANDVPFVSLMGEIEWNIGGLLTSSNEFDALVANDVIRGSEGVPGGGAPTYPAPENIVQVDGAGAMTNPASLSPGSNTLLATRGGGSASASLIVGTTTITPGGLSPYMVSASTPSAGAGTCVLVIATTGAVEGGRAVIAISNTHASKVLELRNATAGGTLLHTMTLPMTGLTIIETLFLSGAWVLAVLPSIAASNLVQVDGSGLLTSPATLAPGSNTLLATRGGGSASSSLIVGTTTITPGGLSPYMVSASTPSAGAGTCVLVVATTGAVEGGRAVVAISNAHASKVLELRNATAGGTLLHTMTLPTTGLTIVECVYTGSEWRLVLPVSRAGGAATASLIVGTTTVTPAQVSPYLVYATTPSSGAGTCVLVLDVVSVAEGNRVVLVIGNTHASKTLEVRNATAGGTLLYTTLLPTTGLITVEAVVANGAWQLVNPPPRAGGNTTASLIVGTTTVTPAQVSPYLVYATTPSSGAGTCVLVLDVVSVAEGNRAVLVISNTHASKTLEVRNATAGGTLLYTTLLPTTGLITVEAVVANGAWQLVNPPPRAGGNTTASLIVGTTTVTPAQVSPYLVYATTPSSGAGTCVLVLDVVSVAEGNRAVLVIGNTHASKTLEVRNATAGGTLLHTMTLPTTGLTVIECVYANAAWVLVTTPGGGGGETGPEVLQFLTQAVAATSTSAEMAISTTPTITDGVEIWSKAITPASTSNKIEIEVPLQLSFDEFADMFWWGVIAIFRGSTCIRGISVSGDGNTGETFDADWYGVIRHIDAPATTSSVTYSIRIGRYEPYTAGVIYVNQRSSAALGGLLDEGLGSLKEWTGVS